MALSKRNKRWMLFGAAVLCCICSVFICNNLVESASENALYDDIRLIPYRRVGLLLGTSKTVKDKRTNLFYYGRIDAASQLMKSGKVKYLLVSGDNSSSDYDEPTTMRRDLISNGVDSSKIFLDYAGLRTLDSVVRSKEVFGQDSITVISQKFHNERAIYIAQKNGMNAIGYNAEDVSGAFGLRVHVREYFARVKVILDDWFNVQPKFLGDKIEIH